jgi:hypothetical protein
MERDERGAEEVGGGGVGAVAEERGDIGRLEADGVAG